MNSKTLKIKIIVLCPLIFGANAIRRIMQDTISLQLGLNSNELYTRCLSHKKEYEKNSSIVGCKNLIKTRSISKSIFIDHARNFPLQNIKKLYDLHGENRVEIDISHLNEEIVQKSNQSYWIEEIMDKYPFHNYYPIPDTSKSTSPYSKIYGSLEFTNQVKFKDDIEEYIRKMSESSDHVASFQIMSDMDDGLGLMTKYVLDHVSDEYPARPKIIFGIYSPPPEDIISRSCQHLNSSLITNHVLTCSNSMLVPLSPVYEISDKRDFKYISTLHHNLENQSQRKNLFSYVLNSLIYPSIEELSLSLYDLIDGVRCASWGSLGCMASCAYLPFSSISASEHIFNQLKPDILPNFENYHFLTPNMEKTIYSDFSYQLILLNDHPNVDSRSFLKDIEHLFWRSKLCYGAGSGMFTKESILNGYFSHMYDGCVSDVKTCPYYNLEVASKQNVFSPTIISLFTGKCQFNPIFKCIKNLQSSWKRMGSSSIFQSLDITPEVVNDALSTFNNTCEILDPMSSFDID